MNYFIWFWQNTKGIRRNTVMRIVAGVGQVAFGLLMVWLSKQFIDDTIRRGTSEDIAWMIS